MTPPTRVYDKRSISYGRGGAKVWGQGRANDRAAGRSQINKMKKPTEEYFEFIELKSSRTNSPVRSFKATVCSGRMKYLKMN